MICKLAIAKPPYVGFHENIHYFHENVIIVYWRRICRDANESLLPAESRDGFSEFRERDWGFGPADAAHVAFAEAGNASFITCDDKLLKKRVKYDIKVWYGNPVRFCTEEDLR